MSDRSREQQPATNAETLLQQAQEGLEDHIASDGFIDACIQNNVEPRIGHKGYDPSAYWSLAGEYAHDAAKRGEPPYDNPATRALTELTVATPAFVIDENNLLQGKAASQFETRRILGRVAHYRDLLRDVIEHTPGLTPDQLKKHLLIAADNFEPDEKLQYHPGHLINRNINGLQHELAFEKMCRINKREFERTTTAEDFAGRDYMVMSPYGNIPVDIKRSLSELEARGGTTSTVPYAVDPRKGVVLLYTMLRPQDFDGFFIPDDVATAVGDVLFPYVDQAARSLAQLPRGRQFG